MFYAVKIRPNPLKPVEIWAKSLKIFTKSLEVWANTWKYERQLCPTAPKITQKSLFLEVTLLLLRFFSSKFRRIRAKILPSPTNLPTPTHMIRHLTLMCLSQISTINCCEAERSRCWSACLRLELVTLFGRRKLLKPIGDVDCLRFYRFDQRSASLVISDRGILTLDFSSQSLSSGVVLVICRIHSVALAWPLQWRETRWRMLYIKLFDLPHLRNTMYWNDLWTTVSIFPNRAAADVFFFNINDEHKNFS